MAVGGKRPGAGRPRGAQNKATAEVKVLAAQYTEAAIRRLADWMQSDEPKASVAAATALLDRAHGKPAQAVDANLTHNLSDDLRDLLAGSIGGGIPTPD